MASDMAGTGDFLYILGYPDGPSKIGHSAAPQQRLKAYRKKDGADIQLLRRWPVGPRYALEIERYIQWQFRHKHIAAEWFDVAPDEIGRAVGDAVGLPFDVLGLVPTVWGKRMNLPERHVGFFPAGTFERIETVAAGSRAAFIREAIEEKLDRDEKAKKPDSTP